MRQTDLSGNLPRWSEPKTTAPDPVVRFRNMIRTLLSHRLAKGQTIDDTEVRAVLAAASEALQEMKWA